MLFQRYSGTSKKRTSTENLYYTITQYRFALPVFNIPDSFSVKYLNLILKEDALVFYEEDLENFRSMQEAVEILEDAFNHH